jgi:hypothetical protein
LTEEMVAVLTDLIPKRLMLSEVEKMGKQAEEERKDLDKELLNLMGDADKVLVEIEGVPYQITKVNGSWSGLDQEALKEFLGEDINRFKTGGKYKYPKITEKRGK